MGALSPVDVLAIGPHPDDIELFCGGTVARLVALGYRVGLVDLTRGELATNGTPEERAVEAARAAELLGVAWRTNLGLPDGFIDPSPRAPGGPGADHAIPLVRALREARPELVLSPHEVARHPDHAAAGALVRRAVFLAGIGGLAHEPPQPRWLVREVLRYPMRVVAPPSFCVDISAAVATKRAAVACYQSQLGRDRGEAATLVNDPRSVEVIAVRDRYCGAHIGVDAAEPFLIDRTLGVADPVAFLRGQPGDRPLLYPERR